MPIEHYYGRLSEEFGGALPTAIWREQQRLPVGFLEQVLEYRSYANAKVSNDADSASSGSSPIRALAQAIEMELMQEAMDEAQAKANGHHD